MCPTSALLEIPSKLCFKYFIIFKLEVRSTSNFFFYKKVEFIRQAVQRGERVLACGPSNMSVDNMLQMLVAPTNVSPNTPKIRYTFSFDFIILFLVLLSFVFVLNINICYLYDEY